MYVHFFIISWANITYMYMYTKQTEAADTYLTGEST